MTAALQGSTVFLKVRRLCENSSLSCVRHTMLEFYFKMIQCRVFMNKSLESDF